jgi:transcriptional regulator with XRE-family HTH domain
MADNWNSSIDYVAIGERLKAYRIGASLQAEDVAEQLGVSRAVIYRIERGDIVKIETLDRLVGKRERQNFSPLRTCFIAADVGQLSRRPQENVKREQNQ